MECDRQFKLLQKLLALEKEFANNGYHGEAHQIRLLAEEFNDKFLIVLPAD